MDIVQEGCFRTRTGDDGSLEVWARGWRLESQLYALIPMGLSLMFLLAPMSLLMRAVGALVMLAAASAVFRMTKPGLWFTEEGVSIISVMRTQRFRWEQVSGFMGERRHYEARVLLTLVDDQQVPLPGTLDPAELDPYGDEGEMLSAADQLNRLKERAMARELPKPTAALVHALDPPLDDPSRKELRRERKALRAALKAVHLTPEDEPVSETAPDDEPSPSRRFGRRPRREAEPELMEVKIGGPEPLSVATPVRPEEKPTGRAAHFPTPVYIPQAEYAQMLRDQKAAERAAVEAAAELRRLAYIEEPEDVAKKTEFSDWTS
jgi:hypothetical protein